MSYKPEVKLAFVALRFFGSTVRRCHRCCAVAFSCCLIRKQKAVWPRNPGLVSFVRALRRFPSTEEPPWRSLPRSQLSLESAKPWCSHSVIPSLQSWDSSVKNFPSAVGSPENLFVEGRQEKCFFHPLCLPGVLIYRGYRLAFKNVFILSISMNLWILHLLDVFIRGNHSYWRSKYPNPDQWEPFKWAPESWRDPVDFDGSLLPGTGHVSMESWLL